MNGKKLVASLVTVLLGLVSVPMLFAVPQDDLLNRSFTEPGQFRYVWDSVHKSLIFVRDSGPNTSSTIRVYQGPEAPPSISTLSDFPGAANFQFWGLSGAPNGGIATAATVDYGNRKMKDLVLTYDQKGKLVKVWDTFPYHLHNLAVDSIGNVYAFGDRSDKSDDDADGDYALLVSYSPQGKVVWESLPRSSFPWGSDMMSGSRNHGDNQLMLSERGLLLFVAATEELFNFDLNGKLLGRYPMKGMLAQIAGNVQANAYFWSLAWGSSGTVIAQVQLWPTNGKGTVTTRMVEVQNDFVNWRPLSITGSGLNLARFLGLGNGGKLLFFARDPNGNTVLTTMYVP